VEPAGGIDEAEVAAAAADDVAASVVIAEPSADPPSRRMAKRGSVGASMQAHEGGDDAWRQRQGRKGCGRRV